MVLAVLVDVASIPREGIYGAALSAATEAGFREVGSNQPPGAAAVRWAADQTLRLCGALGLLALGGDWNDPGYALTDLGRATALEALRARATEGGSSPFGSGV